MIIVKNYLNFLNFLKNKPLIKNLYKKKIFIARILDIKKKFIIFEGNLKSEFSIKKKEFLSKDGEVKVKIGDYVEIFLINSENSFNRIISSRLKFLNFIFWNKIFKILYKIKNNILKGSLIKKIKGGYTVFINDFKCFLPHSCSDKKISNTFYYFDKHLYFSVINFDRLKKNIILSRKILIEKVINIKRKIFFNNIKIGDILKGVVKTIRSYCAIIDIGYLDCIIYSKNIVWGKYRFLNSFFKIGQSIISMVLKIDRNKNRIFLGIKQFYNIQKNFYYLNGSLKYARIFKITTNNIYVIFAKNIIAFTNNWSGKNIFRFLKINDYKKIIIKGFNYKKKRIFFKFNSSLSSKG
ncbi:S1 RNA-binding domain-containing protein [Candidatus Nasuia deltocephalinicola]|uniref:S1 RNA-binding domain-containing protein n=1 Tax=Candidatus Nasuia deltocephalincola TaxID=1160784 RepID=UPI00216B3E72|nr:S1 RNA-binding domain-containing protein [Candidatus Nasuia deltocephalinicola]